MIRERVRESYWTYRFFAGKGGAGKTTCAAAAAMAASDAGRRVLLISTDPAHSLGDALATRLGPRPTRVRAGRGRLEAVELDADRALRRWMTRRREALRAIAERGTYLDAEDIESFLRLSLPGVDELVGLVEVARLARAGRYDDVFVDTAPTGHTLRLLAMPETLRRIAAVLDHMQAKHRFLSTRLGGSYHADASDTLIEEIDSEGRTLSAALRDPRRCAFSWVLLPEALSLEEARDGIRELERWGMVVPQIIVNRVTRSPDRPCALCDGRMRAEGAVIRAIRSSFPRQALRLIPEQDREPRGLPCLRALGWSHEWPPKRRIPGAAGSGARPRTGVPAPRGIGVPTDWLATVAPPGVRLLLFAGKGGTGKTTCAAATALALALRLGSGQALRLGSGQALRLGSGQALRSRGTRDRGNILLLSTDPAHSLADVLGVRLGDEERPVPGAPSGLAARELDAPRAFALRRERYRAAVDELFAAVGRGSRWDPAFDRAVVEDLIELAPPGLDELLAILSITEALSPRGSGSGARTIVVDTAPTGHALRLLALPGAALKWAHALLSILLKYRRVVRLGSLGEDLLELSRDLRQLDTLLRDPRRTRVVAVARAAELPRLETLRMVERLKELGIAVGAVIANAVTPPGCGRCRRAAAAEAQEVARLRAACRAGGVRGCGFLLAPAVAPPPRGIHALVGWGQCWSGPCT